MYINENMVGFSTTKPPPQQNNSHPTPEQKTTATQLSLRHLENSQIFKLGMLEAS